MKPLLLVFGLLVAGLVMSLVLDLGAGFQGAAEPETGPDPTASTLPRGPEPLAEGGRPKAVAPTVERSGLGSAAVSQALAQEPGAPRVRVFGRVVDLAGAPVGGARVELCCWSVWREPGEGEVAESVTLDDEGRYRGFTTVADEAGGFELDVPVPTASNTWITVEADEYLERLKRTFGGRDEGLPQLLAGERDLGDLRLAACGVVRGRVADLGGVPLAGVEVKVAPGRPYTIGVDTRTEADGRYELLHVPAGTWGIGAALAGFQTQFLEPFEVRANESLAGPDFLLEPAQVLAGTVVDGQGLGIEGARVAAWPVSGAGGSSSSVDSDSEGRFEILLKEPGVHALHARAQGFQDYGRTGGGTAIEPGTRDLRIVLEPSARTRFRAFDAVTREPVLTFGLGVLAGAGAGGTRGGRFGTRNLPEPRERETNETEADATPDLDLWTMTAPGYRRAEGTVNWDEGAPGVQTVWLQSGGSEFGRLVGRVVTTVPVDWQMELRWGVVFGGVTFTPIGGSSADPEDPEQQRLAGLAIFRPLGNERPTAFLLGPEGEFAVEDLKPGTYRLIGRAGEDRMVLLDEIQVSVEETTDLGEIEPIAPASIAGRVLLGPRLAGEWVEVRLGERGSRSVRTVRTDASGAFLFEGIAPGVHALAIQSREGLIAEGAPTRIEVAAGERGFVELDGSQLGTLRLSVRVLAGGAGLGGVLVYAQVLNQRGAMGGTQSMSPTDADGRTSGEVLGGGEVQLKLSSGALDYEPEQARFQLPAAAEFEVEVELELGAAEVVLPEDLNLERERWFSFQFFSTPEPGERGLSSAVFQVAEGALRSGKGGVELLMSPPRVRFEGLPLGLNSFHCTVRETWGEQGEEFTGGLEVVE